MNIEQLKNSFLYRAPLVVASHVCTADEQLMRVCVGGRGGGKMDQATKFCFLILCLKNVYDQYSSVSLMSMSRLYITCKNIYNSSLKDTQ